MSVINQNLLLTPEGYQISRSVRLRSSASGNFSRTVGTPTNKDVWTISSWIKYSAGGKVFPLFSALSGSYYEFLEINAGGDFYWITRNSAGTIFKQYYAATGQRLFRDPSAWYHFVVRKTSALTLQFYVNGEEFTLTAQTVGSPSSSINTAATTHYLGYQAFNAEYADGYLTEINFIDGQALTPSSFGETDAITGVWKPKKYTGTYGTNGFYLNFSDNSSNTATTIGKDYSGNGNNWTPNNISVTAGATYDSMLDVPTLYADGGNGRGNYCTLNPLDILGSGGSVSNANLTMNGPSAAYGGRLGTIGVTSGKWYFETRLDGVSPGNNMMVGVSYFNKTNPVNIDATDNLGLTNYSYSTPVASYQAAGLGASTVGDIMMVAYDADTGKVWLGAKGTWIGSGNPASGTNPTYTLTTGNGFIPYAHAYSTTSGQSLNFGQRPFSYTPPTGFKALNTQNLPEPTIKKGNQYFDATTYTGNGSTQSIVNAGGFQPDLVWLKARSVAESHELHDAVRGASNLLKSNSTAAELNATNTLTSFNSNGFSLGSSTEINTNAATFVGWQWKESPSAGFDIVTYTGTGANRTVAHSLGVAPSMMIVKIRNSASDWVVYHADVGNTKYLQLSTTAAAATASTVWNNTTPTSTVFSLGSSVGVNQSTSTYVAYLFSEVAGFSKFGSYTGNGSADGPFVFCGFRPKFVLIKSSSAAGTWTLWDSSRSTANSTNLTLAPNSSAAEVSAINIDFLSNGFKVRHVGDINASSVTSIYAAFAENPFKNSLAR